MVDDFSREWLKGDSEPLGKTPSTMSTRFECGPQTRGEKTRDTLSYKELDDLCRNLDLEGMMRHKKQALSLIHI